MIDAFAPECITEIAVDSIFMMPHLGVLSTVNEAAATEVFDKDCIIYLGTCIAPVGQYEAKGDVMEVKLDYEDGTESHFVMEAGTIKKIELGPGQAVEAVITPTQRNVDVGNGEGRAWHGTLRGGVVGLVFDTRGRPINIASSPEERAPLLQSWVEEMDEYPTAEEVR